MGPRSSDPNHERDVARLLRQWPVTALAAGWCDLSPGSGRTWTTDALRASDERFQSADQPFALASVTKPLFAWAVLVAVEEGTMDLNEPLGPPGATVADLLAHCSGLGPDGEVLAPPRQRRIYSNAAYDLLGERLSASAGFSAQTYVHEAVAEPLGLTATRLEGSPAKDAVGSVNDLLRFAQEVDQPILISGETRDLALSVHEPALGGVLPGFGRQDPNPWGLGFEIKGRKDPHWTSPANAPSTAGHFGQSGTMLWIDRERRIAATAVTNRQFGPWAGAMWPAWSSSVLERET